MQVQRNRGQGVATQTEKWVDDHGDYLYRYALSWPAVWSSTGFIPTSERFP